VLLAKLALESTEMNASLLPARERARRPALHHRRPGRRLRAIEFRLGDQSGVDPCYDVFLILSSLNEAASIDCEQPYLRDE